MVGSRLFYHMLEISRVCSINQRSNFHIFYSIVLGAPESLLKCLLLGDEEEFVVSRNLDFSLKRNRLKKLKITDFVRNFFKKHHRNEKTFHRR